MSKQSGRKNVTASQTTQIWSEFLETGLRPLVLEAKLFTDVRLVGELRELGPYSILNTIAHASSTRRALAPAIALRVALQEGGATINVPMSNDFDHYHGGDFVDEMAALISLFLGIRLKAGKVDREFRRGGDPLGQPREFGSKSSPQLMIAGPPQIPRLTGERNLTELKILEQFPTRSVIETNALIKAARLYQEAVWIADSDPALAWLLFVSAVEAAAVVWSHDVGSPIERLEFAIPKLVKLLSEKAPMLMQEVAEILVDLVGTTKKFSEFLVQYCPAPPQGRPAKAFQFSFDQDRVRSAAKIIYHHRSLSLHNGTAFPLPMCQAPKYLRFPEVAEVGYEEVPGGLAMGSHGASWKNEQTPMLLHTFEHITRGALLGWWKSLAKSDQEEAPSSP